MLCRNEFPVTSDRQRAKALTVDILYNYEKVSGIYLSHIHGSIKITPWRKGLLIGNAMHSVEHLVYPVFKVCYLSYRCGIQNVCFNRRLAPSYLLCTFGLD